MAVRVDGTKCSGIGLCEMTAPDIFEIGDDGQAHVIGDVDSNRDLAVEAVSNCPTSAISFDN